jgi:hypothetical protein
LRDVHPGAVILTLDFFHPGSPIQGSKKAPVPGSATLTANRNLKENECIVELPFLYVNLVFLSKLKYTVGCGQTGHPSPASLIWTKVKSPPTAGQYMKKFNHRLIFAKIASTCRGVGR